MRHIPYFYDQPGDAGEEITRNSDSLKGHELYDITYITISAINRKLIKSS